MSDIGCAKVELARELGSLGQQHSRQDLEIMASTAIRERVGDKPMIALEAPGQKRGLRADGRFFLTRLLKFGNHRPGRRRRRLAVKRDP